MPINLQDVTEVNPSEGDGKIIGTLPLDNIVPTIIPINTHHSFTDNNPLADPYSNLSTEEKELLDDSKRAAASYKLINAVKNGEKQLSWPVIDICSRLFEDKHVEIATRINSTRIVSAASEDYPELMAKLERNLDDENITIQKIIMNRLIASNYHVQNIQLVEKALYNLELKEFALSLLANLAMCKNIMSLGNSTIEQLNKLLDDIEDREYVIKIFANRPKDSITNFTALQAILLTSDQSAIEFVYKILSNISNNGDLIPETILIDLVKTTNNQSAVLKDREYALSILEKQIINNTVNHLAEFSWFNYLLNNLGDENQSIIYKSLQIFKKVLARGVKLPINILDSLEIAAPKLLLTKHIKDDINYCFC
jgi:hypothetical protein